MATTQRVMVGDLGVTMRVTGGADDPPLVLLHGMGEGAVSWEPVLDPLARLGFRVIALDARGHGDSDRPGAYSYELLRDDLLATLDTLGIDRCVLIGHSMGATTAALATIAAPGRVSRLILVDAAPPRPGTLPRPPLAEPEHEVPFDWPLVNALRAQLNDPDPQWWEDTLRIPVPTLVVAGGPTSNVPQGELHDLAERLADGRLVEIPVGHMVHELAPAQFVAAVRDFLATGG